MKNFKSILFYLLVVVGVVLLATACEKEDSGGSGAKLGGDTNLPVNQVGSTINGNVRIGSTNTPAQFKVVGNNNGVVTVEMGFKIPSNMVNNFKSVAEAFWGVDYASNESTLIDANNNFKGTFNLVNSSEGVAIVNSKGDHAIIMKYDVKQGDSWSYKKKNGKSVKMNVAHKSSTDDYNYSGMLIKTVQVERESKEPGVSKIVYIGNHRFGLVGMELYLEDGSVTRVYF